MTEGLSVRDMLDSRRLPVPQTQVAQRLQAKLPEISQLLIGVDPAQFASACLCEANMLRLTLSPEEINEPALIPSFLKAVMNAAVVGLVPGAALGHCYFVPFRQRGKKLIQLIIGYRGFLELGYASGHLIQCDPQLVLTGESCELWHTETGPKLNHKIPSLNRPIADRTNIVASYCTYRMHGGGASLVFVTREEINKIDTRKNVWQDNYAAMCLKSPIRRASKTWRLTRQLASAVHLDEQAERGDVQDRLVHSDVVVEDELNVEVLEG